MVFLNVANNTATHYASVHRSVVVWDAVSNLPLAWCALPHPASCLACSPSLEEIAVGTTTNEILILKVHRRGAGNTLTAIDADRQNMQGGKNDPRLDEELGESNTKDRIEDAGDDRTASQPSPTDGPNVAFAPSPVVGIELHSTKQLAPSSAFANRWHPTPYPGLFSGSPCGKPYHPPAPATLAGGGSYTSVSAKFSNNNDNNSGGASGGVYPSPPRNLPSNASKSSPSRVRARPVGFDAAHRGSGSSGGSHTTGESYVDSRAGGGGASQESASSLARSPSKFSVISATGAAGGGNGGHGDSGGGANGKEERRTIGASCMRYSPNASHLAIGTKNGSLTVMEVDCIYRSSEDNGGRNANGDTTVTGPAMSMQGAGDDDHGRMEEAAENPHSGGQPRSGYRRIAHLKGHSSRVLHLDWTCDGRFLHTCGQDYHLIHWQILPHDPRLGNSLEESLTGGDGGGSGWGAGVFHPHMFNRGFLLRDAEWETWSSTVGWPVQASMG